MRDRIVNGEEWKRWAATWRGDPRLDEEARSPGRRDEILRMVRRQTLFMVVGVLAQIAIAAGFTAVGLLLVRGEPGPIEWVTALATWTFVAIAVGAAATGERRLWRPAGETTRDFVELCRRRLAHRLRNLRWGLYLLALEVAFFIPWIGWVVGSRPPETVTWQIWAGSYAFLAVMVGFFALSIAGLRRRALERLRHLEAFGRELEEP